MLLILIFKQIDKHHTLRISINLGLLNTGLNRKALINADKLMRAKQA